MRAADSQIRQVGAHAPGHLRGEAQAITPPASAAIPAQPSVSAPVIRPGALPLDVPPAVVSPPPEFSTPEGVPHPIHGGQVRAIMAHFPDAPTPHHDLSTGISPFAYPLSLPDPAVFTRLPEEYEEADLQAAAATAYGLSSSDMVVAGAGSQSLISLLPRLLPARRVCLLGPTYSGHAQAWRLQGVPVEQVTDPAALEHAARQAGTVCVVCNPNNPDGRLLPAVWLRGLADQCAEQGSVLIVDEAFMDFEKESVAPLLPHSALVVLRSFGKTYGLPGVRLGFLLANPERAAQARALLGAWPVGSLGLAAGRQALRDTAWLCTARRQACTAHTRLSHLLDAAGLCHTGQVSLFTLVLHPEAPALWYHFCTYGLVTRIFADQPGRLRLGLPASEEAWSRLGTALQAWAARTSGPTA